MIDHVVSIGSHYRFWGSEAIRHSGVGQVLNGVTCVTVTLLDDCDNCAFPVFRCSRSHLCVFGAEVIVFFDQSGTNYACDGYSETSCLVSLLHSSGFVFSPGPKIGLVLHLDERKAQC